MNRYNIVGYAKIVEPKAEMHKFSKYLGATRATWSKSILKTPQIYGATKHNLIARDWFTLDLKEFVIVLPVVYF